LDANQASLGLDNALAFYNFPLFREDEHLLIAQIVLISPLHGVVMISSANAVPTICEESIDVLAQLEGAFSQVFSRLVKYQKVRMGRAKRSFEIDAILWIPESDIAAVEPVVVGLPALEAYLQSKKVPLIFLTLSFLS
jgi:hypothetical protein